LIASEAYGTVRKSSVVTGKPSNLGEKPLRTDERYMTVEKKESDIPSLIGNDVDSYFVEVVNAYHKFLYNVALGIVSNCQVADDIVQESWARAYQSLKSYSFSEISRRGLHTSNIRAWLRVIVHNTSITYLNRRKYEDKFEPLDLSEGSEHLQLEDERGRPDIVFWEREFGIELYETLNMLPPISQLLLKWRFFDELSYTEIAQRLQCSEGAVRVRMSRSLQQARRILEDRGVKRPGPDPEIGRGWLRFLNKTIQSNIEIPRPYGIIQNI
jgi:RNA polymerase sigma factor (sigma-70 family)